MDIEKAGKPKKKKSKLPMILWILVGVIYPLVVIGVEWVTRMCSQAFFDPMPTLLHTFLIMLVPLTNALICFQIAGKGNAKLLSCLRWLAPISIGIAGFYSLLFLPLTPIAVLAIAFMGLGLLPLAPIVSLVLAILLYRQLKKHIAAEAEKTETAAGHAPAKIHFWKGLLFGILFLSALDLPATLTNIGLHWAQQDATDVHARGIKLLRWFGDEELLLRLCFSQSGWAAGPFSFMASVVLDDNGRLTTEDVRQIFYQVTGESFNSKGLPKRSVSRRDFNDWSFDADQGGVDVGARIEGLNLVSSRIDATVAADDGLAYMEWILEFENKSALDREARLQLLLPNRAVISRATLWVNGEEREAAFASKGKVRQAYESIVRRQRDPLLVTSNGGNQVMAQAFPILPRGGTIKFRLGITAPLRVNSLEEVELNMPVIIDRNFNLGEARHALWVEADTPMLAQGLPSEMELSTLDSGRSRLFANLDDTAFTALHRAGIKMERTKDSGQSYSALLDGTVVEQNLAIVLDKPSQIPLMLLIDGSSPVKNSRSALLDALDGISSGRSVGLAIAAEEPLVIPPQPWAETHANKIKQAIRDHDFVGGQDNVPALAAAIRLLGGRANTEIFWLHTPQPINFRRSGSMLEQALDRVTYIPWLTLYPVSLGTNKVIENPKLAFRIRTPQQSDSIADDLARYFAESMTPDSSYSFVQQRLDISAEEGAALPMGSRHIARLWANQEVARLMRSSLDNHDAAVQLAAQYQLVTPVSGAVVLENQQQYDDNDLTPVDSQSVPTIPEPHQWVLILITLALLLWYIARNPSRLRFHGS